MTDMHTKEKCLFIIAERHKYGISKHLKPLKAVYNGIGWYIEDKYTPQVFELCEKAKMKYMEHPLIGESFEDLRRRHKLDFFREKEIKTSLQIESLKREAGIPELTNDEILSSGRRDDIVKFYTQGKDIIDLIEENQHLKDHISHIEEEERIAGITLDGSSNFQHLLQATNEKEISDELNKTVPGISVGYKIGDVDLKIPGGALTILAAPTHHGKTAAAINFCLGALAQKGNEDTSVYFFTYEESRAAIMSLFLNTYICENLSSNNRESIKSYLRDNTIDYFAKDKKDTFLKKKDRFFHELVETGRLNVFYEEMTAKELIAAIHYIKKHKPNVGLICVDYLQLLKLGTKDFGSRQEELKAICLDLKNCAIETGLPIMLGAQFNRTVVCEADLWPTNIGEAGDIERAANTILGFWNRNFAGSREGNRVKYGGKTEIAPIESSIFFEILKSREVGTGHHEILDFHGNSGAIKNKSNSSSVPFSKKLH